MRLPRAFARIARTVHRPLARCFVDESFWQRPPPYGPPHSEPSYLVVVAAVLLCRYVGEGVPLVADCRIVWRSLGFLHE
jgi:hypothetical protein